MLNLHVKHTASIQHHTRLPLVVLLRSRLMKIIVTKQILNTTVVLLNALFVCALFCSHLHRSSSFTVDVLLCGDLYRYSDGCVCVKTQ